MVEGRLLRGRARWRMVIVVAVSVALAVGPVAAHSGADGNDAPGSPAVFRAVTAGSSHSCAIVVDGSVRCWGNNSDGQLGLGDDANRGNDTGETGDAFAAVDLGTGRTARSVVATGRSTCALLDDNTVKCWGDNNVGQLGLGDTEPRGDDPGEMGDALPVVQLGTGRTAISIAANGATTCVILDDGSVKCWGNNSHGALGLGDTVNRGNAPGQMGDALPTVDLGTGRTATTLTVGGGHVCAILDDATLKCWGYNVSGRLGIGDGVSRGDGPNEMGDSLPAADLGDGRTATAVTAGFMHTCALLDTGTVKCWGVNDWGQLGLGDQQHRGDGANEMGDDLPAVNLGTGRTATAVTSGDEDHTCAILDDGSVKCWGYNSRGQLGQGHIQARGQINAHMGDSLPAVALGTGRTAIALAAGEEHTCAVLDTLAVRCWGHNTSGQLGIGDTVGRGDQAGELGDDLPVAIVLEHLVGLAVTLSADETAVRTGEDIHYHVTLTNTGNQTLTDLVIDADVTACDSPVSDLAMGESLTVDCTHTTTVDDVGTLRNSAAVASGQADPMLSNEVEVDVAFARQADLSVKRSGTSLVGRGIYNADAAGQVASATRRAGRRVTFYASMGNGGDGPDRIRVRPLGAADPGLLVRYFKGRTATDLTRAVRAGTYRTRTLQPGETAVIRVEIIVRGSAAVGTHDVTLRGKSHASGADLDTVRAMVTVR